MFWVTHHWWRRRKREWEWVRVTSWQSFAKEIQMRKREWIHWESANNGVRWEYKASCWENGESWRTELTKWISHLLKGSRMLRDPKNPVHSIASCPRSIALRTHFNGNHFDRKFSESHIFLFLLLNPLTTTTKLFKACKSLILSTLPVHYHSLTSSQPPLTLPLSYPPPTLSCPCCRAPRPVPLT